MPALKVKEIRQMSREERLKKLEELKAEIMKLRTDVKAKGRVENPAALRELRRSIARILTVEREEQG
ncbi:50S ribosomal protein L29 [Candidatus Bathyarchaeota archaeon]|nr:MAG: 50S ribosomal protein L29 [Candidatus Bathyarchaeota archaeon]